MSNNNSNEQFGLGLVEEKKQGWGMWFLSWIFWLFFKTGQGAGSVARRTSAVPGHTKTAYKKTKTVVVEVVQETKKGYKAGRTYVAPEPVIEDAKEVPLPYIDPTGRPRL